MSTQEQAQSGLGLEAQQKAIRQYSELYSVELGDVLIDDGYSAKNLDRPGMQEVLRLLESGEVSGVIVSKLDRLTRSLLDLQMLLRQFFDRGERRLISVSEQCDTTTAAGRLVLNVLMSVAEWERETIGERTSAALQAKKARGEKMAKVPIGMRAKGRYVEPDPVQQQAIALAFELRKTGLSVWAIATELKAQGFEGWSGQRIWRAFKSFGDPKEQT